MTRVLIIAEAGVNHNGDINIAKQLIDVAAEAKVDYVKFQTFKAEKIISKAAPKADYQVENTGKPQESQLEMVKKLELDMATHKELMAYCDEKRVQFLSTPFDHESIDLLYDLGIRLNKIPSGEVTNLPYLQKVGRLGNEVILSTGMCNLGEIETALNVLITAGTPKEKITVLHCNTEYPTPWEDVHLKAMNTIGQAFDIPVGYSDHTLGIEVPIAAVALGAVCIEKHFTLDRTMPGPDHSASLEPDELKAMVKAIRNIELALGNTIKQPSPSEQKNIKIARKSIHLAHSMTKGCAITLDDLIMKRPGDGISPMLIDMVIGKILNKDLDIDTKLSLSDLV
jgi:N,N'-diacetyllegionaminate synthase